jgi:hypothetical protein
VPIPFCNALSYTILAVTMSSTAMPIFIEKIFSMNMGIAVDDMVTAKMVYEKALEKVIGSRWPL